MKAIEISLYRNKFTKLLLSVSIALVLIAGKDLLHAFVKGYHFYLSESLLFGSYWLLFIPVVVYGKQSFFERKRKLQFILPVVLGIFHIVLFSGDGDFRPLVESLQRQGVRVSCVSTIRSQPPMISDDLRRQVDNFIELEDLRDVIGRPPRETSDE